MTAHVSGHITFDGADVEDGYISLVPVNKSVGPTAGGRVSGGYFQVEVNGDFPAEYVVKVSATRKTGKQIDTGPPGNDVVDEVEQYIPAKYNRDSELAVQVVEGTNEHSFDLSGG